MPYVTQRWLGGTLTNFHTVRNSISRLQDIRRMEEEGLFARVSKKEGLQLTREKLKLTRSLGGIEGMEKLPDALFVIDVGHESIAVREARRLEIPVVAVVDSNSSIDGIDSVIPGNDDAIRSIRLYMDIVCDAIKDGVQQAAENPPPEEPVAGVRKTGGRGRRVRAEPGKGGPAKAVAAPGGGRPKPAKPQPEPGAAPAEPQAAVASAKPEPEPEPKQEPKPEAAPPESAPPAVADVEAVADAKAAAAEPTEGTDAEGATGRSAP